MRKPKTLVGKTLDIYFKEGYKLEIISDQIKVDTSTIFRWINKYSNFSHKYIESLRTQIQVHNYWLIDENEIIINGNNYYCWDVVDFRTCYLILSHVSQTRAIKDFQNLLGISMSRTGERPIIFISDRILDIRADIERLLSVSLMPNRAFERVPIEKFRITMSKRNEAIQGLRTLSNIQNILDGFAIQYNFFSDHITMNGTTPAQEAKILIHPRNWQELIEYWVTVSDTSP